VKGKKTCPETNNDREGENKERALSTHGKRYE
jgi:hypothetical protein